LPTPPIRIDVSRCRECQACTLACSLYHEGACGPAVARLRVSKEMGPYTFDIRLCRHCDDPPCLDACPTGATSLDARGVVVIEEEECTACGACARACPYEAILHNAPEDRYLKCDLCAGREEGPLCAEICPVGALTFVPVEEEV
jgi:Fe-S-cluster-containing dehydrogenase component